MHRTQLITDKACGDTKTNYPIMYSQSLKFRKVAKISRQVKLYTRLVVSCHLGCSLQNAGSPGLLTGVPLSQGPIRERPQLGADLVPQPIASSAHWTEARGWAQP